MIRNTFAFWRIINRCSRTDIFQFNSRTLGMNITRVVLPKPQSTVWLKVWRLHNKSNIINLKMKCLDRQSHNWRHICKCNHNYNKYFQLHFWICCFRLVVPSLALQYRRRVLAPKTPTVQWFKSRRAGIDDIWSLAAWNNQLLGKKLTPWCTWNDSPLKCIRKQTISGY